MLDKIQLKEIINDLIEVLGENTKMVKTEFIVEQAVKIYLSNQIQLGKEKNIKSFHTPLKEETSSSAKSSSPVKSGEVIGKGNLPTGLADSNKPITHPALNPSPNLKLASGNQMGYIQQLADDLNITLKDLDKIKTSKQASDKIKELKELKYSKR